MNFGYKLKEQHTSFRQELIAALTTFSTMVYIIFVNPQILSEAGLDEKSVMVATILISSLTSIAMGLFANYPFALAPGMGLNAFFAYSLVIDKQIPWEQALGVSFWAGVLFLLLNLLKVREKILEILPKCLRHGCAGGIGLFLAFIGLKSVQIVLPNPHTILSLGNMAKPESILTGFGVILISAMMIKNIRGSILITTMLLWIIGLIFSLSSWNGLFGFPPSIAPTLLQLDLWNSLNFQYFGLILSLVFVLIFDTAGTLTTLATIGGFFDKDEKIPRVRRAMGVDAMGTIVGAMLGCAPITTYLESATGITAGGKTGLTAILVGLFFLCALFLAPLASSIPSFATAPALIVIGGLMVKSMQYIDWEDPSEYLPGFLTLMLIPLTSSLSTGIAFGFISYTAIKLLSGKGKTVHWINYLIALLFCFNFATGAA